MDERARSRKRSEPQVRGERVVQKVLEAALEELSRKGLAGLSMEEVADRAGVAKTTVYRRWPTKVDLAVAAMRRIADDIVRTADTGSLRGDLIVILQSFRDFAWTARGQGLIRMLMTDVMYEEIAEFARRIREEKSHEPRNIVLRAIARGELPRGTDPALVLDVAFGAVQNYLCFMHEPVEDPRIEQIIDLLLIGAQNGGAVTARPSRASEKAGVAKRAAKRRPAAAGGEPARPPRP